MEIVKVSEVDYAKGQIKVEMPAKDNIVSSWITFPNNEYEMPEVGDLVRVERSGWDRSGLYRAVRVTTAMDDTGYWSRLELARPDFVV